MKQEKIKYYQVMDLGFKEKIQDDKIYFQEYGFEYAIITKKLTKKIHIDWDKATQLCEMIRIDGHKEMNVMARMPIMNLEHLEKMINFFSDEQ